MTHALLRGSRIFPDLELYDDPPDYTPRGFTDIWNGEYHGELVCVKAVRGHNLTRLREVGGVRRLFYSIGGVFTRFIPDIPSRGRKQQAQFSSECAPRHPGFGGGVPVLHHEPVDARWEHYSVYPSEPGCRSSDPCTCPSVEIDEDDIPTTPAIARTSVPRPHAPSWVGYFTRQY